jgi:hypothetical protein
MTYRGPARSAARSLASSSTPGAPSAGHRAPPLRLLAAVALVAQIAAGCSIAPAETASGGGETAATEGGPNPELKEKLPELAKCMRENGVKDFPDPVNGEPLINTYKIPSSSRPGGMTILNAAIQKCRPVLDQAAAGQ